VDILPGVLFRAQGGGEIKNFGFYNNKERKKEEKKIVPAKTAKKARKRSNKTRHRNTTAARKLAVATTFALSHPEPAP